MDIETTATFVTSRSAAVRAATRADRGVPVQVRPDVQDWATLREQLATRAAQLQQAILEASECARRYDAVGDHLLGGVQWRKAHLDQVRLAELESTYALVDEFARQGRGGQAPRGRELGTAA